MMFSAESRSASNIPYYYSDYPIFVLVHINEGKGIDFDSCVASTEEGVFYPLTSHIAAFVY